MTSTLALTNPLSSVPSAECVDQIIVKFASASSSTSTPMLRPPTVINDEVITTAYIKFQVNIIAALLEGVSKSGSHAIHKREPSLVLVMPEHSMSIMHLRRQTVRQVAHICDLLEMTSANRSISKGVQALSQLSFYLGSLKMDDDAVLMSNWTVRLSRILLGHLDHVEATVDLARNLLNYSIDLRAVGDDYASLAAIEEAYAITQILVQDAHDTPTHILLLHCLVLDHYALTLSDPKMDSQKPLGLVKESARITESVLTASTGLHLDKIIGRVDLDLLRRLCGVASSKDQIVKYAQTRSVLASLLAIDGQSHEALISMRLGLALYRGMSTIDTEIIPQLASALYRVIVGDIGETLSGEERLGYTNECIDLYRDLAHRNPTYYTRRLVNVVWAKADLLRTMQRHDESLVAWKEVVHLSEQLAQDARLYSEALNNLSQQFSIVNRYDDAASTRTLAIAASQESTMEVQAEMYFSLYGDLQLAGRNGEAIQAIRTSLALYRMLAVRDPNNWAEDVGIGLSALAECLVLTGDYDNALSAGRESVQILNNLLKKEQHPWPSGGLFNALRTMHNIAFLFDDGAKSREISSEVMEHYNRLFEAFPEAEHVAEDILFCQHYYGVNLYNLGHLIEARGYFERLLATWMQGAPSCVSNAYMDDRRLIALNTYVEILHSMGQTNHGMAALPQAINIATPLPDSKALRGNLYSISLRVFLMIELGQHEEAVQMAEEMLRITREGHREGLVGSLHTVAAAAARCRSYGHVVEVAEEALIVCQKDESLRPLTRLPGSPLCERVTDLPRSLKLISFGFANLGRIQDGLQYAKEAVVHALKLRALPSLASSVATGSYIETRGNLGNILVASGSFSEALEIFEERRGYFSNRVEARNGEYRELVPTLYILGTLYCNDGRHEDGLSVAEDLRRIMICLRAALPTLHEQIVLCLQHELMTPTLQVLNNMHGSLQCNHQAHVTAVPWMKL
ncbi:hypothetical protein D9619_004387 [Psilocybe cf. subviscida]|uniref:Uncharacterized protein n=1 Tax=Psilocybe cf. subviscida TaxID=2480587 RepID=A0A8H5F8V9_9AGAR|nr:hypothetical protein D9619_004387 [Psilocybe cf. subviscida]